MLNLTRPREHLARHKRVWWIVLALGLLLVAGRLAAPALIAKVVRKSIDNMEGGYHGDIDDVELSVLGAEVAMLNMTIVKKNGRVPVPFMRIERFVLGVILDGYQPRTALTAVGAHVNMVDAEAKADQQWGPKFELRDLRKQLPFELAELRFEDSEIHFRSFEARPKVDLVVHHLTAAWENLTGCLPPGWASCDSTLSGRATVMRGGRLALRGRFDRHAGDRFEGRAVLENLQAVQLNPTLLKYAKIDAQEGRIDLTTHYRIAGEAQRLVLVPRLYDVKVAGAAHEGTAWLREVGAGIAAGYFERRRGTKAIAYKSSGGEGGWSLIDWGAEKEAAGPSAAKPLARATAKAR